VMKNKGGVKKILIIIIIVHDMTADPD
jgi:hypothetical protein